MPWTLLVVVAALAGATLLYLELQYGNRPSTGGSGRSSQVTESVRPTTSPSSSTSPTTSGPNTSASMPPPDAGTDAAVDASVDGGTEGGAPVVAPAGMVYVPPPEVDAGPGARGYFIDRTEVTVKDYRACVKAGSCEPATEVTLLEPLPGVLDNVAFAPGWTEVCNDKRGALEHPANCVKHSEARAYCKFVQKRLPTAAEYRLAAAGVQAFEFPWGAETPSCERACFGLNNQASCLAADAKPATCEVGTKKDESPYGALDLAGNVAEWVEGVDEGIDGGAPHALVFGGSFADEAPELKTTRMLSLPAVTKFPTIGFRCAKPAPPLP
ncbi:MAG: SUMF1/EgtB/PvdO family nonheme iron enzyme [Myxococcales bacterium]|nr:SUMF1/EgtB/PvdO family nonheme iron enzyme [Myxococcales bacterium]